MKLHRIALFAVSVALISCTGVTPDNNNDNNDSDNTETPEQPEAPKENVINASAFLKNNDSAGLTLSTSTNFFQMGVDTAYFVVRNDGKILKDGYKIYEAGATTALSLPTVKARSAEGEIYDIAYWIPSEPQAKSFWCTYKTYNTKTTPLKLTAVDTSIPDRVQDPAASSTDFVHRAFVMDFTGVNCGYCPFIIATIDNVIDDSDAEYHDKAVVAEVHSYGNGKLAPKQAIDSYVGVPGYPYVVIDYSISMTNVSYESNVKNLKSNLQKILATPAKAGISANYVMSGNTLMARMTVKAAETGKYRAGMWIVEDGLEEKQANYGMSEAYTGQFDTHNDVLRYADCEYSTGNFSGHDIGTISKGEYADYVFTVQLSESWVKDNCSLIFFVVCPDGNKVPIVNAIRTKGLSGSTAFQYND